MGCRVSGLGFVFMSLRPTGGDGGLLPYGGQGFVELVSPQQAWMEGRVGSGKCDEASTVVGGCGVWGLCTAGHLVDSMVAGTEIGESKTWCSGGWSVGLPYVGFVVRQEVVGGYGVWGSCTVGHCVLAGTSEAPTWWSVGLPCVGV